jgi:hypothetical protein
MRREIVSVGARNKNNKRTSSLSHRIDLTRGLSRAPRVNGQWDGRPPPTRTTSRMARLHLSAAPTRPRDQRLADTCPTAPL